MARFSSSGIVDGTPVAHIYRSDIDKSPRIQFFASDLSVYLSADEADAWATALKAAAVEARALPAGSNGADDLAPATDPA